MEKRSRECPLGLCSVTLPQLWDEAGAGKGAPPTTGEEVWNRSPGVKVPVPTRAHPKAQRPSAPGEQRAVGCG